MLRIVLVIGFAAIPLTSAIAAQQPAKSSEDRLRLTLAEAATLPAPTAIIKLEQSIQEIESDPALTSAVKESLKSMVHDRLRILRQPSQPASPQAELSPNDARELDRAIRILAKLRAEPDAKAASQAATSQSRIEATNRQLQLSTTTSRESQRGFLDVTRQIAKSGVPAKGDIEYPADWREKTALRSKATASVFTPREQEIARVLNRVIDLRFDKSRLEDVLQYLQTILGKPVVISKPTMDQAGLTYDSTVTINVRGVSARTALRKLFNDIGLTFIVKDEVLQAVTLAEAQNLLTTRVYYVGDLVQTPLQAIQIIDLITSTIDPQSWARNGGPGSIAYNPITGSLVIKQSAEFHYSLGRAATGQ